MAKSWKTKQRNQQAQKNYFQEFRPEPGHAIYQYDPYMLEHKTENTKPHEILMTLWQRKYVSTTARQNAQQFRESIEQILKRDKNLERAYRNLQKWKPQHSTYLTNDHATERHELLTDTEGLDQILNNKRFANGSYDSHEQRLGCIFAALLKPESDTQAWSTIDSIYDWLEHAEPDDDIRISIAISNDDLPDYYKNQSTKMTSLSKIYDETTGNVAGIAELETNAITLIIKKRPQAPYGFIIYTDYPDVDLRTMYVANKHLQFTHRDISDVLHQTQRYQTATPKTQEKMEVLIDHTRLTGQRFLPNQLANIEKKLDITRNARATVEDLVKELIPQEDQIRNSDKPNEGAQP